MFTFHFQALTFHIHEESPLSLSVIGEYDMEFPNSSNLKLESKKRYASNSNDQTSETFRKAETRNSIAVSLVVFFNQMGGFFLFLLQKSLVKIIQN